MNLADLYPSEPSLLDRFQDPSIWAKLSVVALVLAAALIGTIALTRNTTGRKIPAFVIGGVGGLAVGGPAFSWIAFVCFIIAGGCGAAAAIAATKSPDRTDQDSGLAVVAAGCAGILGGFLVAQGIGMIVAGVLQ